jgi:hypothetical protein
MMNLRWDKAFEFGWIAILCILTGYELFAVSQGKRSVYPPLTWMTVRYAPWWVTMPFLTWLWIHFATRYLDPNYLK